MNTIIINGKSISVLGKNISISGDKIIVDGKVVSEGHSGITEIKFEGDLASLESHNTTIYGNINGSVKAHNLTCKDITGDIKAHNVNCVSNRGKINF